MDDKYTLLFLSDALRLHSYLTAIDIEWASVQLRQQQVPPAAPVEVSVILRCDALHTQALTKHRNHQSAFNISHRASLTTLFLDFLLCWPFHPLFFFSSLPRPLSPSLLTHTHIYSQSNFPSQFSGSVHSGERDSVLSSLSNELLSHQLFRIFASCSHQPGSSGLWDSPLTRGGFEYHNYCHLN